MNPSVQSTNANISAASGESCSGYFFSPAAVFTGLATAGTPCCINIYLMSKYLLRGFSSQRGRWGGGRGGVQLHTQGRLQFWVEFYSKFCSKKKGEH